MNARNILRSKIALLIGAVVVISAILTCFLNHQNNVKSHNKEKLAHLIQASVAAAGAKNQQAIRICETEINIILDRQFPEVAHKGRMAAQDIASYGSCCKLIYFLARDKITGSHRAADYVDERMQAYMGKPLRTLSDDLDIATGRFELSLKGSTVCLAHDLAQITPRNSLRSVPFRIDGKSNFDLNRALSKLGINGTAIGLSIPLDIWFLFRTTLVKSLISKVVSIAARLFAKTVTKAAVTVALSEIPVADIISVVGGIWTAYDVYSTQKAFESEMKANIDNMMPGVRRDIQKQVMDHVHSLFKEHERLQDEIRQRSVKEFAE